ncbi:MAG TPA: hypothetical protein VK536_10730 [Candidatus Limnocylindrales bacterium]|nr:hypothetical protein [Candidatus Limnocylindrales bacterium]
MEIKQEIPCANCKSWDTRFRKFACKPHDCKKLSAWLQRYAPQLGPESAEVEAFSETSIRYVV